MVCGIAMSTTLIDIRRDIIQTHILPRLDPRSLSTLATVSSDLHSLCSDHNLWSHISKSTWPSITHPQLDHIISTFPGGHRSFFHDSFPSLTTTVNPRNFHHSRYTASTHTPLPSQLISAVDIRYQTDIIYSTVQFTDVTTGFMSSEFLIKLNEDGTSNRSIDMEVDAFAGVDEERLPHLKDSVTLNWIIIDPTLKRTGNLSTIKPVTVKKDWTTNETLVQYVSVLPGCDPPEMVKCRIQVVLGVGDEGDGLKVKEVTMKVMDLDSCCLKGREFLAILRKSIMEENNTVRRAVVGEKERWERWREFKEIKRQRRELVRNEQEKWESDIVKTNIGILVSFCFSVYFLSLMLQ